MAGFPKMADGMHKADCHNRYQEQHPWIQQPAELPIRCATSYDNDQRPSSPKRQKQACRPRFRTPRLAHPRNFPQQQSQIIGRTLERMGFAHIGLTAHPTSPTATGLADMGKGSFASLAAPAVQLPALVPAHAPTIGPEGRLKFNGFVGPTPDLLSPLGDIRSQPTSRQLREPTVVMVPLVHHHFANFRFAARQAPGWPRPDST